MWDVIKYYLDVFFILYKFNFKVLYVLVFLDISKLELVIEI